MRFEQLLSDASDKYGDRIAVVSDRRTVTYRELEQLALACASRLKAMGAGPGEATVVMAPNSLAFLVGYFGALMSGATVPVLGEKGFTWVVHKPALRGAAARTPDCE
jgi:acyl-CoA synthetase (AMP-forming)/AMP-acid ligase II